MIDKVLQRSEMALLVGVAGLLIAASLGAFWQAFILLLHDLRHYAAWAGLVGVLDRILLVLMLVELLHTVLISIRSGELRCQPFLIVGLIAAIRRILVVTLQSVALEGSTPQIHHEQGQWVASMVELGVLGLLITVMVIAISLLRRTGVA